MTSRSTDRATLWTRIGTVALLAVLSVALPLRAQNAGGSATASKPAAPGRIVGRVLDAQSGQGIVGVMVNVPDAGVGGVTGVDGRYIVTGVPAGASTLRVQSLGYATKLVTGIAVPDGGAVELNITLEMQAVELAAIEVSAGAERGSVNRALDQQRTATAIVNAVTAEQISRSPDADAAAAMQRMSGVTVQDGKYVHVRGLGERYTTTSLNGARIPSPEPERKIVPLDLFPAALLQTITTSKTFTPDQPGDFSGAQVDIRTREFPAERQFTYSMSFGYNNLATGKQLRFAPQNSLLGFAGNARALPQSVRNAGTFEPPPSRVEMNRMLRDLNNAWSADDKTARPNGSFGFSLGGTDAILGRQIAYLVSGTYSRSEEVKSEEVRAQALAGPAGSTIEADRFQGITGRNSVLWGGLLNLSTLVGTRTRLAISGTYNRTSDNEARSELGASENLGGLPLQIERLRFVERAVLSGQLKGEHELTTSHRADWSITASRVERNEPDRSEIVYAIQSDPVTNQPLPPAWFSGSNEGAVRTFGELSEQALEAAANYRFAFGGVVRPHYLKLGGLARAADRDSDTRALSISTNALSRADRELQPEQIFDGRFARDNDNILRITPLSQGGSYRAEDQLLAGYAMLDFAIGDRVRLVGGARIERSDVKVTAQPTLGLPFVAEPTYTDVLPALTLNVQLGAQQNLRLSASQTLARPEYRELAGVAYRDVLGGDNIVGNPELVRTLIQNADLRWEWYPNAGEVVSLGLFAKHFDDPIERVYLATSGTRVIKYVNAEAARNYGVELELRKRLGTLSPSLESLTAFTNATLMDSDITIGSSGEASTTNDKRSMVGQAPYVVNAGLTWATPSGNTSATALYNVVGKRIVSAGEMPLPDVYEQSRNVLDLSFRLAINGALAAKLDAKNLLDEPYEIRQGTVLRESYRAGRTFSFGLSWKR